MERSGFIIVMMATLVMSRCGEGEKRLGEDCSIKAGEIHFTKSLNHAAKNTTVENNILTIRSNAKTDYFNDPDGKVAIGTAPLLLSKADNTKPFTLTTKVTPSFASTYDAGALYIFSTDQLWQKFAFERDEQGRSRIVSVRTMETSDDNNHDIITQESVYLKISSDTKALGFYYSTNGVNWNLVRLYKNNYPEMIWLGLSSQSPTGDGNATHFENCSLTVKSIKNFRMGI